MLQVVLVLLTLFNSPVQPAAPVRYRGPIVFEELLIIANNDCAKTTSCREYLNHEKALADLSVCRLQQPGLSIRFQNDAWSPVRRERKPMLIPTEDLTRYDRDRAHFRAQWGDFSLLDTDDCSHFERPVDDFLRELDRTRAKSLTKRASK